MANKILIIFQNVDQAQMVSESIEDNLQSSIGTVNCTQRMNEADAFKQLRLKNFDLIIVDFQIPKSKQSKEMVEGIALLKKIFDSGKQIPSILVYNIWRPELYDASFDLYRCLLVELGEDFETSILEKCKKLLSHGQVSIAKPLKNAVIDIKLDADRNDCFYEIKGRIGDSRYIADGILDIDRKKLNDLIIDSRQVEVMNLWESQLQNIGKTLVDEIFKNNYKFTKEYTTVATKIGDFENIKFRFRINRPLHPLLLEAMFEEDEKQYYMLRSPIYRKINVIGQYPENVFSQPDRAEKINCLIVKSEVKNLVVPKLKKSFPKLDNITIESSELYELLNNNRNRFNVDKVEVIDSQDKTEKFASVVKDKLKQDNWHLVHYAGHSYYDCESKKGYVIFPDKHHPIAKEISEFGQWLRMAETQLLFLSSCHSSSDDFVFEMVNNGVPAIIGFRWDLNDRLAAKYSNQFYKYLFENKNTLEHAFLKTRQEMHKAHSKDRIWASPMLVIQC
jgi:CheY-like chemotaxis protein